MIQVRREKCNSINSRKEFNRCSIPRLSVKMGQKVVKNKSEEDEILVEQMVEEKIRKMKRSRKAKNDLRGPSRKRPRLSSQNDFVGLEVSLILLIVTHLLFLFVDKASSQNFKFLFCKNF